MLDQEKLLTLIIPLRLTEGVYQAEERLRLIMGTVPSDLYEIVVVDYGTGRDGARLIAAICAEYSHVRLVRVDSASDLFSIGVARDIGVQHARTPVIMFNDIDFYGPEEMYRRIHSEVKSRGMATNIYEFFCIPVMWLTEEGMPELGQIIDAGDGDRFIYRYHSAVVEKDSNCVDTIAYGSSAIVANRFNYLALGGHNRRFAGHGAEDYDLLHRLATHFPRGPRTGNYYTDVKSNKVDKYEGFRAFFATYGIDVFQRGIFLVHMWHPKRSMPGYFQSRRNFSLLGVLMAEYDRSGRQPKPLPDLQSDEKTLVLVDPTARVAKSFRYALPAMGNFIMVPEKNFPDAESLISYFTRGEYTRIGFLNPYGNGHRLSLYMAVRNQGIPYWTFDRGALPESWFFDQNGFNADSKTYDQKNWDIPLSDAEVADVHEKCRELRVSDNTLEENGTRSGAELLREMFGLGERKVIFVPLQRPSDTVMRYFADPVGNMENFAEWVSHIAENLDPAEWAVVVKKHPLESELPEMGNVYVAPADCHIHDLLELADKVMLVNSGTGVLSMVFGKPVIYCGDPFYKISGVNYAASTQAEALQLAGQDLAMDRDKADRFLHYLWNKVYSFGPASYDSIAKQDGSSLSIVTKILFRQLRGLSDRPITLGVQRRGISLDAPLFYSFGSRAGVVEAVKIPTVRPATPPIQRISPTPKRPIAKQPPSAAEKKPVQENKKGDSKPPSASPPAPQSKKQPDDAPPPSGPKNVAAQVLEPSADATPSVTKSNLLPETGRLPDNQDAFNKKRMKQNKLKKRPPAPPPHIAIRVLRRAKRALISISRATGLAGDTKPPRRAVLQQ